jgi:hypothetical protein
MPKPKMTVKQLDQIRKLYAYTDRYNINIQLWVKGWSSVYIEKDEVNLKSYGSYDLDFTLTKSLEYLNRINRVDDENPYDYKPDTTK